MHGPCGPQSSLCPPGTRTQSPTGTRTLSRGDQVFDRPLCSTVAEKTFLDSGTGLEILQAGAGEVGGLQRAPADEDHVRDPDQSPDDPPPPLPPPQEHQGPAAPQAQRVPPRGSRWGFGFLVVSACVGAVLAAAMTITCLRRHAHRLAARKLGLGPEGGSFTHQEYQVGPPGPTGPRPQTYNQEYQVGARP